MASLSDQELKESNVCKVCVSTLDDVNVERERKSHNVHMLDDNLSKQTACSYAITCIIINL